MAIAWKYRQYASECRLLARKPESEQQRNQLLKIAEACDRFAAEIDRREQKKLDGAEPSFSNPQLGFANFPG
jgi:hypothetical protein